MAAPMKDHEPIGKLVFERSAFTNRKEKHRNCISDHYFNSAIHVLCPSLSVLPPELDDIMTKQMSYLATKVSLQLLLSMDFIEGFVKKGDIYMLSHGTCIDSNDCIALLPTGVLILNLTKDTFQQLGLEGKLAKYGTSYIGHDKHVVKIELLNQKFFPEMKYYERVKWCLSDRLDLTFDFLLSWKPNDTKVCPTSIQNFFQSNGCVCKRLKIPRKTTKYENFKVPVISPDILHERSSKKRPQTHTVIESSDNGVLQENRGTKNKPKEKEHTFKKHKTSENVNEAGECKVSNNSKKDRSFSTESHVHNKLIVDNSVTMDSSRDEDESDMKVDENEGGDNFKEQNSCGYLEVFEWLGACAAGIDLDNNEDCTSNYVCSLTCPSPNITLNYGVAVEYRGLITPHTVQELVDFLRTEIYTRRKMDMPWCSVSVHGFMDSPVSWTKRFHGFYNNGDNLYTLLIFKDESYWLYRAFGAKDVAT